MTIFIEYTALPPGSVTPIADLLEALNDTLGEQNITRWENGLEIAVSKISEWDKAEKILKKFKLLT